MTYPKDFISSLTKLPEINVTMERWMYRMKELECQMASRTVFLCLYFDRIPEESLVSYADSLIEALSSEELTVEFTKSAPLYISILNYVNYLKSSDVPIRIEKANLIFEKVNEKFQVVE